MVERGPRPNIQEELNKMAVQRAKEFVNKPITETDRKMGKVKRAEALAGAVARGENLELSAGKRANQALDEVGKMEAEDAMKAHKAEQKRRADQIFEKMQAAPSAEPAPLDFAKLDAVRAERAKEAEIVAAEEAAEAELSTLLAEKAAEAELKSLLEEKKQHLVAKQKGIIDRAIDAIAGDSEQKKSA